MSELDGIRKRAEAYASHGTPGLHAPKDRQVLLAALDAVLALAEEWRYKGEFGWGPHQEGYGPNDEGWTLDNASAELRAAIQSVTGGEQ